MGEGRCSRSCTMNLVGISRVEPRILSAALALMNPTATESQEIGSCREDKHGKQDLLKDYLSWKCSSPQHILVCMNNNHIQGKILALESASIWLGSLDSAQRNYSIRIISARKRGSEATENATSKMMTTKIIPWHRNTRALISWFAGSHRQVNIVKPLLTMNSCSTWYRCADQEEGNIGSWHWKTANVANLKLSTKHINSSPSLLKPFEIHYASLQRIVESQQQQDGTRIVVCGPRQEESSQLKGRGNPYKREFKIIYRRENCHVPPRTWSRSRLSCLAVPAMFETRRIQISCNTNDSWSASKNNHHWIWKVLCLSISSVAGKYSSS